MKTIINQLLTGLLYLLVVSSTHAGNLNPATLNSTVGFIENKGQFKEEKGLWNNEIFFKSSNNGIDIYITSEGVSYLFVKKIKSEEEDSDEGEKKVIQYRRVDLKLLGASISESNIQKEDPLPGHLNYFYAHCPGGISGVREFKKVIFKNVYKGIDWVLYYNHHGFKYDFIVHPGADASVITLRYNGAKELNIRNGVSLTIATELGEILEGALYAYEGSSKNNVPCLFKKEGNEIRYQIGGYNKIQDLIIDPPVTWSTYYGATGADGPVAMTIDKFDNIFIAGYVASSENTLTFDPGGEAYYQATNSGGSWDLFMLKFDKNGVRQWATHYGGTSDDRTRGITTDPSGNVLITGSTKSTDLPLMDAGGGAYFDDSFNSPDWDMFITQFDNNGKLTWATYYGGSSSNLGLDIIADATGNIYATGTTYSVDFPLLSKSGAFNQAVNNGDNDLFILQFDASRVLQWSTYYGGSSSDEPVAMHADKLNNIIITGITESNGFPTYNPGGGAYFKSTRSAEDVFIIKFSSAGVRQWATFYGGTGYEVGHDIATDAANNIYITGITNASSIPTWDPGGGAYYKGTSSGSYDLFLLKFSNTGVPAWGTFLGGSGQDDGFFNTGMAIDKFDNVYITGRTGSTNYPILDPGSGSFVQSSKGGGYDVCLTQFNNAGTMVWSTYYGGPSTDWGRRAVTDSDGCLYITGEWLSTSGITVENPGGGAYFQGTNGGSDDGFLVKFCAATELPVTYLTFEVYKKSEEGLTLKWTAFSDKDEVTFIVQRSEDGVSWSDIGEVNSAASRNQINSYYHTCPNPYEEGSYFRIRQTDKDGSVSFTKVLYVNSFESTSFVSLSPNPVKSGGQVKVQTSEPFNQYQLLDMDGRTISQSDLTTITSFSININQLNPGMYYLKFTNDAQSIVRKLVVE